jgi:hypothetical protein
MISIEKLIQAVNSFNEKPLTLPEDVRFVQRTACDLRKEELEIQRNINKDKVEQATNVVCDYTMSKDFGVKQLNKAKQLPLQQQVAVAVATTSSLSYVDNEIIDIPAVLLNIFKHIKYDISEWYIYGMKNPNSFFKAVLMLNNSEYILKTNADKINYSMTFKREIAIQLDALYRQYKYQQWNFKKLDMVNQLLNESVITYALIIATADYIKKSLVILDINKKDYQIYPSQENVDDYYFIIKDGATYLPIMNSNGNHKFNDSLVSYIKNTYDLAAIESTFKTVLIAANKETSQEIITPTPTSVAVTTVNVNVNSNVEKVKFAESKMTLIQIQELAKVRGLDITKEGKQGKQISKTKKELCDEMNAME